MTEQVILSAYFRTLKKVVDRALIESTCKICGEVRLASHLDLSLDEWEWGHSLQHEAALSGNVEMDHNFPEVLPVSPLSLACPQCNAKPGKDCVTLSGGLAVLHLARIKAAAAKDTANKPKARKIG